MSYQTKHRTRMQKANPHYGHFITWKPQNELHKKPVKGNLETNKVMTIASTKAIKTAQTSDAFGASKHEVFKTLIIASLIFIFQSVLYFFLK